MTDSITVWLESQPHPLPVGTTLDTLVATLQHEPQAVTTAINGDFVARGLRAQRVLQDGDQVLLFQPIVGG